MKQETMVERKENNIMVLTLSVNKRLDDLRDILDTSFRRGAVERTEMPDRPQIPNVLDAIIDGLERANGMLAEIIAFVSKEVIPKIS